MLILLFHFTSTKGAFWKAELQRSTFKICQQTNISLKSKNLERRGGLSWDRAALVRFPPYWHMIWFLNVVPRSSSHRLSPGQELFWVQLQLNVRHHRGQKTDSHKPPTPHPQRRACVPAVKGRREEPYIRETGPESGGQRCPSSSGWNSTQKATALIKW